MYELSSENLLSKLKYYILLSSGRSRLVRILWLEYLFKWMTTPLFLQLSTFLFKCSNIKSSDSIGSTSYMVARVRRAKINRFWLISMSMQPGVSRRWRIQLHCSRELMNIYSTPMWRQYVCSRRRNISRSGNDFSLPPMNVVDGNLKVRSMSLSSMIINQITRINS